MSKRDFLLLGFAAMLASSALIGHAIHQPPLATILPTAVAMKQLTALLIFAHAMAMFLLRLPDERRRVVLPLVIIAGLNFLMIPGVLNEISHLENWRSFDPRGSFYPSVMTIFVSAILAARILVALFFPTPALVAAISTLAALIGALPLVGYALRVPALYYFIPGYATAMALPTAAAFLAIALVNPLDHPSARTTPKIQSP